MADRINEQVEVLRNIVDRYDYLVRRLEDQRADCLWRVEEARQESAEYVRLFRYLSEKDSVLLTLHYYAGKTISQVAQAVGLSVSQAQRRISAARRELAEYLGEDESVLFSQITEQMERRRVTELIDGWFADQLLTDIEQFRAGQAGAMEVLRMVEAAEKVRPP